MGQKVHPLVLRLGFTKNWRSNWYADRKEYAKYVVEDRKIRDYIKKKFEQAAVSSIVIERLAEQVKVRIASARPGVIIGRRGADIDRLKGDLSKITSKEISIDIQEIKNPSIDAQLIAQNIGFQLAKRVAFRRAMKRSMDQAKSAGAKGIKVKCSGRLGGAEMARTEGYRDGKVPLQTLRADIDYGFAEALTTYGIIGIKVWVYKGDVITDKEELDQQEQAQAQAQAPAPQTQDKG